MLPATLYPCSHHRKAQLCRAFFNPALNLLLPSTAVCI
jgi:hypothetical protein